MKTIVFGETNEGVFIKVDNVTSWTENRWGHFDQWIAHIAPKEEPVILIYARYVEDENEF